VRSQILNVEIPKGSVDSVCKAAVSHIEHEHSLEGEHLKPDNPATERLDQIVSETYDAMAFSLLKELSDVFRDK
jgi:hypothetical protein